MYDLKVASDKDVGIFSPSQPSSKVNEHAKKLKNNVFSDLRKLVAKYPLYVNQYFMKRANKFMDGYARDVIGVEYYWRRVEFAVGRGQIHLHILGIEKNKAYLHDFYGAETEQEKNNVMDKYSTRTLDLTAVTKVDKNHNKFDRKTKEIFSPLGIRFGGCTDKDRYHCLLAQDCMHHDCNDYCLGKVKISRQTEQETFGTCRFGSGTKNSRRKGHQKQGPSQRSQNHEGP